MAVRTQSARPAVAVEITSDRVLAARAANDRRALESHAARSLGESAVLPSLQNQNLHNPDAVRQAVAATLESVGTRGRDVTVVVPDAAARIMLIEFDTFPDRDADALPLLRFRLKKLLPFDVERAAISYQASRNGTIRVVAAVAASTVVEEYEGILRDLGYIPGVVLPSTAACLGLLEAGRPTLIVKADAETTSVAIADRGELRLVRTLEGPPAATAEHLADDLHPLLVFFQDTFGSRIERILIAGRLEAAHVRSVLERQTEAKVEDLVPSSILGGSTAGMNSGLMAGVVGAVIDL